MNAKKDELMLAIDLAGKNELVKNNRELFTSLVNAYGELNDDKDFELVCMKLNSSISKYLLNHQYQAPQALMDVAQKIQQGSQNYYGHVNIVKL